VPYLAFIDEGIIWLVIIVGSIIVQVIKGAQKTAANAPKKQPATRSAQPERRGAPPAPKPRTTYQDRKDELRQFLERIANPMPEMVVDEQSVARVKSKYKRKAQQPPPAPSVTTRTPALQVASPAQRPTTATGTGQSTTSEQTRELRALLKSPRTQRQAILLREILGPPIALR